MAVRRGQHIKSAGYSGHVAQAGTGPGLSKGTTRLPSPFSPSPAPSLLSSHLVSSSLATATLCQAPAFCSFADSTSW